MGISLWKYLNQPTQGGHAAMMGHGQPWPVPTRQGSSPLHGPRKFSRQRLAGAAPVGVISAFVGRYEYVDTSIYGSRSGTGP